MPGRRSPRRCAVRAPVGKHVARAPWKGSPRRVVPAGSPRGFVLLLESRNSEESMRSDASAGTVADRRREAPGRRIPLPLHCHATGARARSRSGRSPPSPSVARAAVSGERLPEAEAVAFGVAEAGEAAALADRDRLEGDLAAVLEDAFERRLERLPLDPQHHRQLLDQAVAVVLQHAGAGALAMVGRQQADVAGAVPGHVHAPPSEDRAEEGRQGFRVLGGDLVEGERGGRHRNPARA